MRKLLLTLILSIASNYAFSQMPVLQPGLVIPLQVCVAHDPIIGGIPMPKSPVQCPTVSIDDHTLYIYDVAYAFTLYLLDEDGEVAYTASVAAGTPIVTLPSDLTGDYELLLVPGGSYYFSGGIEL